MWTRCGAEPLFAEPEFAAMVNWNQSMFGGEKATPTPEAPWDWDCTHTNTQSCIWDAIHLCADQDESNWVPHFNFYNCMESVITEPDGFSNITVCDGPKKRDPCYQPSGSYEIAAGPLACAAQVGLDMDKYKTCVSAAAFIGSEGHNRTVAAYDFTDFKFNIEPKTPLDEAAPTIFIADELAYGGCGNVNDDPECETALLDVSPPPLITIQRIK